MYHFELSDTLNRYFHMGCKTFTRHELLAYGGLDRFRVGISLRDWESRGYLQILHPLESSPDGEIIIKLLRPIENPGLASATYSP